jgi:hypothetical protein
MTNTNKYFLKARRNLKKNNDFGTAEWFAAIETIENCDGEYTECHTRNGLDVLLRRWESVDGSLVLELDRSHRCIIRNGRR